MKKNIFLLLLLIPVLLLTACDSQSAVEKATGLSAAESRAVEQVIESAGVQLQTIQAITPIPDTLSLGSGDIPYEIKDKQGSSYILVLNGPNVIYIMDMETGDYLHGSGYGNG